MTQDGMPAVDGLDGGLAAVMLDLTGTLHDWLAGERQFFLDQGYTADEARAMAAATYVTVFGGKIQASDDD